MGKTSTRQRVTQLQEWMKTLKSKRVKPVNSKQSNRLLDGFKQQNNRRDDFK